MNRTQLVEALDFALTNPTVSDVSEFVVKYLEEHGVAFEVDDEESALGTQVPNDNSGYRLVLDMPGHSAVRPTSSYCTVSASNGAQEPVKHPKRVMATINFEEGKRAVDFVDGAEDTFFGRHSQSLLHGEGVDLVIKDSIRRSKVSINGVNITPAVSSLNFEVVPNDPQPYVVLYCPLRTLRMDVDGAVEVGGFPLN